VEVLKRRQQNSDESDGNSESTVVTRRLDDFVWLFNQLAETFVEKDDQKVKRKIYFK
jgi:hypothetical protein